MKKGQRGFTLLEILLVVGIISVLAGIVIIAINPGRQLAQVRNTERKSDIKQIKNAMEQYYIDHSFYPASTTDYSTLTEVCDTATNTYPSDNCSGLVDLSELVPAYIIAIPKDPTATSTAGYQVMKDTNRRIILTAPDAELGVVIAIGTSTATTTASLIPTDGLVAYWSLNANTINAVFSDNNYSPDNFTTFGEWSVSNTNFTDTYGYSVKYVSAGSGSEWAQWDFTVPISGQYNVYATWNALYNRGSNVPYSITHDGGTSFVTADQTQTSHPFFNLIGGPYNFTAGENYTVRVTNNTNGIVIADAIRIAPVGNSIACSEPTNCPSEVSGVSAKALSFTGNINSGTPTKGLIAGNINIEDNITLSAWIYPTVDQNSMIISKMPVNTQWALRDVNNKIVLRGGSAISVTSSSSLIPNQWYHVVGIIEGTVGTIYINGVLDKTGTLSTIGNDDTYIAIGDEKTTGVAAGYPFFGTIDEVRIYNRALTSGEITNIYNEEKP